MFRSLALAIGITVCIIGLECLFIDKAVLTFSTELAGGGKELVPPEWAPWTLLGVGAVVILYSFTIPRRVASG